MGNAGVGVDTSRARLLGQKGDDFMKRGIYDSAEFYYRQSGESWPKSGSMDFVNTQIGRANALLRRGEYDRVVEILQHADTVVTDGRYKDSREHGNVAMLLGFCFMVREDHSAAERYVAESIRILTKSLGNGHEKVGGAHYTMGLVQKMKGDYASAMVHFEQARTIQQAIPGPATIALANTLTMLGTVYDDRNEFDRAIQHLLIADSVYRSIGQSSSMQAASCYLNLMSSYNNKGEYEPAIAAGKKVMEIYSDLGLSEHQNVASALSKLGEVYANLGDNEKAKEYFFRALDLFTAKHPHSRSAIGGVYQFLGELHARSGDMENALIYASKGIGILKATRGEYHPQVGYLYALSAGVYRSAGQYDTALYYYNKALFNRQQVMDARSRSDISEIHSNIAKTFMLMERRDSALVHLFHARTFDDASSETHIIQRAMLRKHFGEYYRSVNNFEEALTSFHSALELFAQQSISAGSRAVPGGEISAHRKEVLELLMAKASVLELLSEKPRRPDDLLAALRHYQRAMDVLDEMRRQYTSDISKFSLAKIGSELYRSGCRAALRLSKLTGEHRYVEEAFLIADRSKGKILLERLFDSEARHFAGIPDSLLEYERELVNDITRWEIRLSRTTSSGRLIDRSFFTAEQTSYLKVKTEYQAFVGMLEQRYPKYYELKYMSLQPSVRELQSKLTDSSAVVEYLLDDDRLYAFTVTKRKVSAVTLNHTGDLRRLTQQFTASLKTYDAAAYCRTGYSLYSALLRPLEASLSGKKELIMIPDGYLHYIPFEALPQRRVPERSVDFTAVPYLIDRFEVRYAYSAAFTMVSRDGVQDNGQGITAIAGFAPVFKDSLDNADFLANRASVVQSGLSDARSITMDGRTFNELPYSGQEIAAIERTMNRNNVAVTNFLNGSATEENFKYYAPKNDIVHVATHGFINENNPKFSAIIFSQPKAAGAAEDGILYVNETFNLDLKARLVVLSSCESGIGTLVDGEGMIALSRGLFYSGAKNIMYSLWKVSDKLTFQLMEEFYKNVSAGTTFSASLRNAKRSMIKTPETAFPAKWSGFILNGR
jgi:CHAT domain-containing protein/lipopolysaccharide biosynthesis regulator YciM